MGGRKLRAIQTAPVIRVKTQIPRGPRRYKFSLPGKQQTGPGDPPPGFLGPTVSKSEWWLYWAMFPALQINVDARRSGPPYVGWPPDFSYQQPFMQGRAAPGGAIADFVIWRTRTGRPVLIRLVTEYWHLYTDANKQVADMLQRQRLEDQAQVIDVYDYTFTHDPSGAAAIQVVKAAVGLIEMPDPLRAGTARRNAR